MTVWAVALCPDVVASHEGAFALTSRELELTSTLPTPETYVNHNDLAQRHFY